jgi:hypothetical protein
VLAEFIDCDDQRWCDFLARTKHDFYHLPEYLRFSGEHEGGRPAAFYAEHQGAAFLAPVLFRDIPEALGSPATWSDTSNPYGYANPLFIPSDHARSAEPFLQAFLRTAQERNVVSAFFRMHPLLPCCDSFNAAGTVMRHGQTVHIDLTRSSAEIWSQIRHDHREDVRKLERAGFQVVMNDWKRFPEFIQIYRATMTRVRASSYYHFGDQYFADLKAVLGERLHLCILLSPDGEFASGGLFTAMRDVAQGHLAGTSERWLAKAPSKLVIYHQFLHAKEAGSKLYHLGGGVGAREDALFRFKTGFSKLRSDFATCRIIVDKQKYELLCERAAALRATELDAEFFPQYRQ